VSCVHDNHDVLELREDAIVWSSAARFMPVPATASEKAAFAASQMPRPVLKSPVRKTKFQNKTRIAVGSAAVAVAVAVPNLSLGAVVGNFGVGSFGGPYFDDLEPVSGPVIDPANTSTTRTLATDVWSPAQEPAGPIYAEAISAEERAIPFSSTRSLSEFDRELPVAVLASGSREFDLAFAGVEMPTGFVAPPSLGRIEGPAPLFVSRADTIRTATVNMDQITDMGLVVRATPEDAGEQGTTLSATLPIARTSTPNQPQTRNVQRAIPVAAPPQELRGAAAAETLLVPKAQMDARVNGVLTGNVDFEQRDGTIAIRLRSVANVMREQFSRTELGQILGGSSIDRFVTLEELQAAGIPINYNPAYDEVEFGIDYQDAPNAKKVQVDQISVAPQGAELTAIEQIPR